MKRSPLDKRQNRRWAAIAAGLIGFGCLCSGGESTVVEWTVLAHHEKNGFGLAKMEPVRVREGYYLGIREKLFPEFKPKWGYEYDLVLRSTPHCMKIDAAQLPKLTIDSVEERPVKPGTSFTLHYMTQKWLGPDRRSFVDGQKFSCGTKEACEGLDERANANAWFDMKMKHGKKPGDIVLESVSDPTCRDDETNMDCVHDKCVEGVCVELVSFGEAPATTQGQGPAPQ